MEAVTEQTNPIRAALAEAVLRVSVSNASTKFPSDTMSISSALLQAFIQEAVSRATQAAQEEGLSEVLPRHVQRIAAQLLLDF
jgi:hypothetical protein